MASDLQQTLERVSRKTLHLTERYNAIRQRLEQMRKQLDEREQEIVRLQAEVERLSLENDYLKVVTTAHHSRADVERSRAVISKIGRAHV